MAALSRKQENDLASLDERADHLTNEVHFCETHIVINVTQNSFLQSCFVQVLCCSA